MWPVKRGYVFLLFLFLGGVVFSPTLSSFFYWDDFPLICISRYVGHPLCFFVQNYFPGGFYYRPLGMLFYWFPYQLFGLNPMLHNLFSPFLHVLTAFLFYLLLREFFGRRPLIALWCALLFLLHPIGLSTSLASRFDLVATSFLILTIYLFLRFLATQRKGYFVCSVVSTLLAILSKEISYILPLLITLVLFTFPRREPKENRTQWILLLSPYYLISFFLYVTRSFLLKVSPGDFFKEGIVTSFWNGFSKWIRFMPDQFLSYFDPPIIGDFVKAIFLIWFLLVLAVVYLCLRGKKPIPWHLFLLSLGTVATAGFLTAPVMGLSTFVPTKTFSFFLIAEGRFYYLSLLGWLILLGSSLSLVFELVEHRKNSRVYSAVIFSVFLFVVISCFLSSFSLGRKWRELTNGDERQLVELAAKAVQESPSVVAGSKVYFLNTQMHSHFSDFADGILKSMAPKDSKLIHCLFFTEKPPWYNFVLRDDFGKIKIEPLSNRDPEKGVWPFGAGDLTYLYLTFPEGEQIAKDERAVFFEFLPDEKRFINVTHEVRSGLRKVQFFR